MQRLLEVLASVGHTDATSSLVRASYPLFFLRAPRRDDGPMVAIGGPPRQTGRKGRDPLVPRGCLLARRVAEENRPGHVAHDSGPRSTSFKPTATAWERGVATIPCNDSVEEELESDEPWRSATRDMTEWATMEKGFIQLSDGPRFRPELSGFNRDPMNRN